MPWELEAQVRPNGRSAVTIKTRLHDGWTTAIDLALYEGAIRCTGVHHTPDVPSPIRSTPLSPEVWEVVEWEIGRPIHLFFLPGWEEAAMRLRPQPGRKGHPDRFYAVWARRYLSALEDKPRSLYKHMAQRWPGYSIPTMKQYVLAARERGLLTAPRDGRRTGGELTEYARVLLEMEDDSGQH